MKLHSKKGVSEVVGYAIMILIVIGLAIAVFAYLKGFTPKDSIQCPEGISVAIKEASCERDKAGKSELLINISNTGRFKIDEFYIKFGESKKSIRYTQNDLKNVGAYLSAGAVRNLSISPIVKVVGGVKFDFALFTDLNTNFTVEVQPVIGQGSTWAVCSDGSVSKVILCS